MRRQNKFLASLALYAIDLTGLTRAEVGPTHDGASLYKYEIPAVWFRRRRGLDTSNVGYLWDFSRDRHEGGSEEEARSFLEMTLTDGRQGGSCRSRWDGERLWSEPAVTLEQARKDAEFLQAMLDAFPQIPSGYDGWWRF